MVNPHRLTQEAVEALEQGAADPRRLTQVAVEVMYQQALHRLTQEPVEVLQQVTGASLLRRLTQVVVEVAWTNPIQPWIEQVPPGEPAWTPVYAMMAETGQTFSPSYWGPHERFFELGGPSPDLKVRRR